MGRLSKLQKEKEAIQDRIDKFLSVPEDTFPLGTVMLFSAASGAKWYIRKNSEESWIKLTGTGVAQELATWILEAVESSIGYFEVYRVVTQETPFFVNEV